MRFLILLLLSTSVLALKPHSAIYTLSVSDFKIAEVQIALSEVKGVYTYTLNAQTEGLVSLITDYQIRSKSVFTLNEFGIQSQHYQNFERDGDKVKKDINIYLKNQQVDPLNQTLAIANSLKENSSKNNFYLLLNDGKSVKNKQYQQTSNKSENIISIISSDGDIEVHFDKNQYFLPILIRNKKFTYQLKSIQF